jgi:predicted CxxxxCH...CXXCH cytochrome family protein
MKRLIILSTVLSFTLIIGACSELKEEKSPTQGNISVHGVGFAIANSENSHTKFLQNNGWNTQTCKSCHGFSYDGGTSGQSCNTSACHNKQNGPENCTTCHGSVNAAPPKDLSNNISPTFRGVGAHQKHLLGGILGAAVSCNECHKVPTTISAIGHIDATNHAEVRFDSTSAVFVSNASYNAANVSCANTYCHGNFNGGNNLTVTWNGTSSTVTECGSCHGDVTKTTLKEKAFPKTGHTAATVTADCWTCHGAVVNSSMAIIDPSKHVNGRIN